MKHLHILLSKIAFFRSCITSSFHHIMYYTVTHRIRKNMPYDKIILFFNVFYNEEKKETNVILFIT